MNNQKYPDVIVVVITSIKHKDDKYSIPLLDQDLEYGVLPEKSFIKIHKLFTISKQKIIKKFSKIRDEKFIEVHNILTELFKIK
ncbi:MAG: type II toxin-antitoxin system PemK/MazF family toxin [Candidatus Cloacimonetes bacterium]|nr:type II toxin-antitoxin system PemK/MazF family toxin [Candidatus Cloacimonadota bacterium]